MKIKQLQLKNFKCFEELSIEPSKITLLTGANSSGKSSILYSLLGVIQSTEFPFSYSPNGKYVKMGDYEDIVFQHSKKNNISINLNIEDSNDFCFKTVWKQDPIRNQPVLDSASIINGRDEVVIHKSRKYHLNFTHNTNKELEIDDYSSEAIKKFALGFTNAFAESSPKTSSAEFKKYVSNLVKINKRFHFTFNEFSEVPQWVTNNGNLPLIHTFNLISKLSNKLEKNINFISSFRLYPERTYYELNQNELKVGRFGENYQDQIIQWETHDSHKFKELIGIMKKLSLFEDLKTSRMGGGRYEVLVRVKKSGVFASLNDIGFGISQFLPIIVADLQLEKDSTLFVAQPEIHLHPSVQAEFGDYIVNQVNEKNKNYFIETHSEYLLNRIRLLIAKGELKEEDVAIYYLENDGKKAKSHKVEFLKNGQIQGAPQGFFDTYMLDVMDIALTAE